MASGSASISQSGAQTNITQSSQTAIINWQDFSIGEGNTVKVVQPNTTSALLNRVTGSATSTLAGTLSANGRVYLINPNGIAITSTGKVQAQAFTASTLDISDADFKAGKLNFTGKGSSASVSNAGTISVASGGYVALMGGSVSNSGLIVAPLGKVGLGSGEAMTLDVSGDGFLQVAVPTTAKGEGALVANSGTIRAEGGSVVLTAAAARTLARHAVNLTGVIEATSVSGHNGAIRLSGGEGQVAVSGTVKATGADTSGGSITVTGREIALSQASLDASGKAGGGTIRIGGDAQGQGALAHAETVSIDARSTLKANATTTGNGGNIIAWSDGQTSAHASFEAKTVTGKGGTVETSGASIDVSGVSVDTSSANGQAGTWLIDPTDLTVDAAAAATISTNLATTNVTLQTNANGTTTGPGNTSSGAGDITVNSAISWSSNKTLTLNAYHALKINAPITISGAGGLALAYDASDVMNLTFNGTGTVDYGATDHGGTLAINAANYALIYTMDQLDAIDGRRSTDSAAIAAFGTGMSGKYSLATDLDASAKLYTTALVGYSDPTSNAFQGTFEGLGHKISNLTVNASAHEVGLFGKTINASIRDFGLVNAQIVSTQSGAFVGTVVGDQVGGHVDNVSATGTVSSALLSASGGLVGNNTGTIKASHADVDVAGTADRLNWVDLGGLVGHNGGTLDGVYASGDLTGNGPGFAGGLVGVNLNTGTITNAYATGDVGSVFFAGPNGPAVRVVMGGLVGNNVGALTKSFATGKVNAIDNGAYLGGLIGINNQFAVLNTAYATGVVTGTGNDNVAGGLLGGNLSNVNNTYATGNVILTGRAGFAGGLVGDNGFGTLSTNYAIGTVLNTAGPTGGLVGRNYQGTIASNYASGAVLGLDTFDVGGLVGRNTQGTVALSYFDVNTTRQATGIGTDDNAQGGNVTGLTTAQSRTQSAYAGWDFGNTWVMADGYTRPFLISEASSTIHNAHQLQLMAMNLSSNYTLANDIDAAGTNSANASDMWLSGFVPIGNLISGYNGSFNGADHVISNLYLTSNGFSDLGLFGVIGSPGSVSHVGFENYTIDNQFGARSGALAGSNFGHISDAYANGTTSAPYYNYFPVAGALVGLNEGFIANAHSSGTLSSGGLVGGLVGVNGSYNAGTIATSYSTATVLGTSNESNAGGLVGLSGHGLIKQSFATGGVTGLYNVGGLVGSNQAQLQQSYATGAVTGINQVGGLVGAASYWYDFSVIDQSYATGFVTGNNSVGGLVGYNSEFTTVTKSYFDTQTTGKSIGIGLDMASETVGGLTTAQFQSGTLPTGFSATVWGTGAGLYPYLKPIYQNGVQAISGNMSTIDGAVVSGASVNLVKSGMVLGTSSTGANGYYYVAVGNGTLGAGTNNLLVTSGQAATLANATGGATQTGVDVYANTLKGATVDPYLSLARANLKTAALSVAGANAQAQGAITGAGNLWLDWSDFNYFYTDEALDLTGALVINAPNAAVGISNVTQVEAGGLLKLISNTVFVNANVTVKGAGSLDLISSAYDVDRLTFFNGSKFAFANADGSLATFDQGAKLSIAGQSYGLVYNLNDLAALNYASGHYGLAHSLDATGNTYSTSLIGTFDGTFDGLGNSLDHVNIQGADTFTGVFGILNPTGYVRDLTLDDVTVSSAGYSVGGLVGYNNGGKSAKITLSGVAVTGNGNSHAGGLVGYNSGTVGTTHGYIDQVNVSGTVTGHGQYAGIGGLVGWNAAGYLNGAGNMAVVSTDASAFVGGLAGVNNMGVIVGTSTGSVSANGWGVGGAVGYNLGNLAGVVSSTQVTGTGALSFIGGLVGVNALNGSVGSSDASGQVSGTGFAFGGLVGYNVGTIQNQSHASGSVSGTGDTYVGGLAGFNLGQIDGAYATGAVSSTGQTSQIGGLVGQNFSGSITNAYATGAVSAPGANSFAGGLIGVNKASVTSSYATGNVTSSGYTVGGLVGWNEATLTKVKYTLGTITAGANTHVGGIVGYNYGTIDQAYASGVVNSTGVNTGVGGLVGWQASGSLTNARSDVTVNAGNAFVGGAVGVNFSNIDRVLATGHVTGSGAFTGGLAGFNAGTITNGYYDYQTTGQAAGVQANGSQGIATTTLQNGTLPTNFASSLWGASSGQYPQLKLLP